MVAENRIIHVLRPSFEGVREQVLALTAGLASRRCEPYVVGPLDRSLRDQLSRAGVRWVQLPLPNSLAPRDQFAAARALKRFVAAAGPALIHAHGFQSALTSMLAVRHLRPRPRLVCTPYGLPPLVDLSSPARLLRRFVYRRILARCDAIVAGSRSEGELLSRFIGRGGMIDNGRISVVPPGVERRSPTGLFDVGHKRRSVGLHPDAAVVVTSVPEHHPELLEDFLHAAALLSDDMANVEFAVIGDTPDLDRLKAVAHELRLTGNAVFLGERADAQDIIASCNVMAVLASDPWSVPETLRALAQGVRVVAPDTAAVREVLHDVNSIPVVRPSDHRGFADALRTQLEKITDEEETLQAATGLRWGVSEVLVSQNQFDLDRPGLEAVRPPSAGGSDVDRLLGRHTTAAMLESALAVYAEVLAR